MLELPMIRSFKDRHTANFFGGKSVKKYSGFKNSAERKLTILDNAVQLRDLKSPSGNKLEKLTGNRAGEYSIRINNQWRICFVWKEDGPYDVGITDYH